MEENSNFQLRIEASKLLVLSDTVFQKWILALGCVTIVAILGKVIV